MSDWTPEDVDALFQEGSEGHEFEYNEAAWGQMENLLERRDRRRRLIWWIIGASTSFLLFVFAYTIWRNDNSFKNVDTVDKLEINNFKTEQNSVDREINAPIKKISPKQEKETTNPSKETKTTPIASTEQPLKKETAISLKKSNTQAKTADGINDTTNELTKNEIKKSPLAAKRIMRNAPLGQVDKTKEQTPTTITKELKTIELSTSTEALKTTASKVVEDSSNNQKQTFSTRTALTNTLATLPSLSMQIDYIRTPIDFTKSLLEDLSKVQRLTTELQPTNPNHFVIGLLLSKEFSFVDMSNMTNLKWKAGLSLEYRFRGKYALKLGANYSQKDYMTSTIENYRVADGFWNKATAPNTASAVCDVLEVSLSESYFVNGHDKKGFFINAGLTSYFLLKEQYDYTYDTNDPELLWSWGENNANRHWFGIGEVSIGYNLPFTDKSSLQIAPYAQIPLTGVGHGELKLFSSGVLIRYNFHLK